MLFFEVLIFYCFRMNGPAYHTINFNDYVDEYVARKHERCDALYPHGGPRHKASGDRNDDEELTTKASTFSALYAT